MIRIFPSPSRRRLVPLTIVLVVFLSSASLAWAHALLLRASPAQDVVLPSSPPLVHLWFSEDLNGAASRIVVWDRYRHVMNQGQATLVPGQPRQMEVHLKPLSPGSYLVLWTSVSAQDGHILHGFYLFSVKHRGPGPSLTGVSQSTSQGFPDGGTMASLLAHWVEMLAAVSWVGAIIFSTLLLRMARPPDDRARSAEQRRLRRLVVGSLVALLVASCVVLLAQAYSLAGSWQAVVSGTTASEVFKAQYGKLWIGRQALALLGLLTAVGVGAGPLRRRSPALVRVRGRSGPGQLVLGLLYLYIFAASGHAASAKIASLDGSSLISGSVFVDWLHYVADAAWFGGQIYIVLVLIPALRLRRDPHNTGTFLNALDRFSPVAYASVAAYTLSGVFAAKIHIPSWYAFFNSVYGRTLIVKVALIGLMMLTSVFTVYLVRPRLRHTVAGGGEEATRISARLMDRLLRWLHVNPTLGAGVLLATSVMFYYPVPPGLAPTGPTTYTARGGGMVAQIHITPDRSGPNQLTVNLRDTRGRPVQQASVTVLTTMLDMVMGQGLAPLQEKTSGQFQGTTDLGMGGHWRLQILVYQPSGLTRMNVDVEVGT